MSIETDNAGKTNVNPALDMARVAELAALSALAYDRVRLAEAERLGVRVATLDEQVIKNRKTDTAASSQGASVLFDKLEPWPEAVDSARLLDALAATFRRYIVLPEQADVALALWVLFTHCLESCSVSPILALTSPEKRCGKSTLLGLLSLLTRRALPSANITASALFRAVESWFPTLLIDEADTFLSASAELRGVLNSGHTKLSAFVIRTVGDQHEPRRFSTWGAKAIALIGKLPDTLADRSIEIRLRRKRNDEKVEKLRHADGAAFVALHRQCMRFAIDHADAIRELRVSIPDSLNDRAADNWEPLLVIATIAGNDWVALARKAAVALSGGGHNSESIRVQLLTDIHALFAARNTDRLFSAEVVDTLASMEDRPWSEWKLGSPLTQRQLAVLLAPFGIHPKDIRASGEIKKGYEMRQFADAFDRYLSAPIRDTATTVENPTNLESIQDGGADDSIALNPPKDAEIEACRGVADPMPLHRRIRR